MRNPTHLKRTAAAAALIALALGITGCSFTTTAPTATASVDPPPPTTPAADDGVEAQPVTAPTTLSELVAAFDEAGLIDETTTYPLAFDGIASDAVGWEDAGGGYVEFYYVDLETASDAVKANYELAKSEGTADYGGGILIPIDGVAGPFMIAYSSATDAAAVQAEWERLTASLS